MYSHHYSPDASCAQKKEENRAQCDRNERQNLPPRYHGSAFEKQDACREAKPAPCEEQAQCDCSCRAPVSVCEEQSRGGDDWLIWLVIFFLLSGQDCFLKKDRLRDNDHLLLLAALAYIFLF